MHDLPLPFSFFKVPFWNLKDGETYDFDENKKLESFGIIFFAKIVPNFLNIGRERES